MDNANPMTTMNESEERNWALFSHLGVLAGSFVPLGNFLLPLMIWQIHKDKSTFITDHSKEALNFQITMFIIILGCVPLCFLLIGIPLIIIATFLYFVFSIVAAIKAGRNEYYDYPFNFRFIK